MKKIRSFNTGDRVAYTAHFLRSIGCHTGEWPRLRGTIQALVYETKETRLYSVKWDTDPEPATINAFNLAKVGTAAFAA